MSNQPFIRQLTLRNFCRSAAKLLRLTSNRSMLLIGPNASGKCNLVEAIGVLRAATKDMAQPFREAGIAEWLWKGPGKRQPPPEAVIDAIFLQSETGVSLDYTLIVTQGAGGKTELVDQRAAHGHAIKRD